MAVIKNCTCSHPDQDKLHGTNKRVHNECASKNDNKEYRCTVCHNKRK